MTLDTAIARFRAHEQDLFRSECVLEWADPDGDGTVTTLYTGGCMIRPAGTVGSDQDQGDNETRVGDYTVKFPADTTVQIGAVVTVTSSPDGGMAGRYFRLTDIPSDDWQVNRKCAAEEVLQRGRPD